MVTCKSKCDSTMINKKCMHFSSHIIIKNYFYFYVHFLKVLNY